MSNPFAANGWLITSWAPDESNPVNNGIPASAFQLQAPLAIQLVPDDSGLYAVTWQDQGGAWCSASGLAFNAESLTLQGSTLVNFGGQSTAFCFVTLTLTVSGIISVNNQSGFPDVGSGTFTATATPPPPPVSDESGAQKKSPAKRKR